MIHAWRTPFWLIIAASFVLLIAAVPTPELRAAQVAPEPRCTDAAALGGRDTAYTNFSYQLRFGLTKPLLFPGDEAAQWKMLIRTDPATAIPLPFAVFYTEDGAHAIHPSRGQPYYDDDNDDVPDFAERVYNCLVEAHSRYSIYYDLDDNQKNVIAWMPLEYVDGANRGTGTFHPVYIQVESHVGLNEPWFMRDLGRTELVGLKKTYINIDSTGTRFDPALPGYLENTAYHELFHAYQALYKEANPFDVLDFWTYEGTAVFATDQALLLPCSTSLDNPPRIQPTRVFSPPTNPCRPPDIYERISESQLREIFTDPWLGLRRDNGDLIDQNQTAYDAVLFWYYAQAKLQTEASDRYNDVIRSFWMQGRGDEDVVGKWASQRYGVDNGLPEMYHRYVIANYLRDVSYAPDPDYDNPYFTPWWPPVLPAPAPAWAVRPGEVRPIVFTDKFDLSPADPFKTAVDSRTEHLGASYFAIDVDLAAPVTSTLEVKFQPAYPGVYSSNLVTLLDLEVNPKTKEPTVVLTTTTRLKASGDVVRIPGFHGANRRAVLVVSQGYGDTPFSITAGLLPQNGIYYPSATPDIFSPNLDEDTRNSTTTISYTLRPITPPTTTRKVDLTVIDQQGTAVGSIFSGFQLPAATQPITWDGQVALNPGDTNTVPVADGAYVIQLATQEYQEQSPLGSVELFTTTVSIDTVAPPQITDLQYTQGPTSTDTLSWTAVPTDTSPGGWDYLVYVSTAPITDTNLITETARYTATQTAHVFPRLPSTGYFAVVTEDRAGNRSAPVQLEQEGGKVDVVLLVDASGSMNAAALTSGIDGNQTIIDFLEDNDRVAVREIEDAAGSMPLTLVDAAARATAKTTLDRYRNPGGGSPMESGLIWALDQFKVPGIETNGRPHIIVMLSDGDWNISASTLARIKDEKITLYAVTAPSIYLDHHWMQRLKDKANAGKQESQFFAVDESADDPSTAAVEYIVNNYNTIARAIHGQVVEVSADSLARGTTRQVPYGIDTRTRQATITVRWNPNDLPPRVTLTSPDSALGEITPTKLPVGVTYKQDQDSLTYTVLIPELPPGLWTINITNSGAGSSPPRPQSRAQSDPEEPQRVVWHSTTTRETAESTAQNTVSGDLAFTLETGVHNAITTTLWLPPRRYRQPQTLEAILFDAGRPLTDTTFVWTDLTHVEGMTDTLILRDDGQYPDSAADDGRYTVAINAPLPFGPYHADLHFRHFAHDTGYIERTIRRDLYLENNECDGASSLGTIDPYEPNNSRSQAKGLAVGETQRHVFCRHSDEDWVTFSGEAGKAYRVDMLNPPTACCNNYLYLYDTNGHTTLSSDGTLDEDRDLWVEHVLTSTGTFYVSAEHWPPEGNPNYTYDLRITEVSCQDGYESNNSVATAGSFTVGITQTHAFCLPGDEDWVKFTAQAGWTYTLATSRLNQGVDTYLELYSSNGNTHLRSNDNGGGNGASRITYTTGTGGTYYVRVTNKNGVGSPSRTYDLQITGVAPSTTTCSDGFEPDNSIDQSTTFDVGTTQRHAFCVPGDEDWVVFIANPGTTYRIDTLNLTDGTDTFIEVYGQDTTTLLATDDNSGGELASLVEIAGSYQNSVLFVKVRHADATSGNPAQAYDLQITAISTPTPTPTSGDCTDQYEPDDSPGAARSFTIGETQSHAFCVAGDQDWISFAVDAGASYRIETLNLAANVDTYLDLYASDGTTLLDEDDDGAGNLASRIAFTPTTAGTYYVKARHYSSTRGGSNLTYDLRITRTDIPTATATATAIGTAAAQPTTTSTPTMTHTPTLVPTATRTPTLQPTTTSTATSQPTVSPTLQPTATSTATPQPTAIY